MNAMCDLLTAGCDSILVSDVSMPLRVPPALKKSAAKINAAEKFLFMIICFF
jgi:hypothetical protein